MSELVELFARFEVPHAPILGIKEALAQPQALAREMVVETDHKILGKIPIVNRPIKFPVAPQPVRGEHTDEILKDVLGLTSDTIEQLRASKVVA